ncbi:MAG: hypothetical protein QG662_1655 [Pseudomonadota bacterium]|nr:hypothetical protein [Pseudomonadota bacterium]
MTDLTCGCAVAADPLRLRQVLINLLSNAVKYNREGGSIKVSCRITDDDHVRISVRDSGIGIAAEAMPRLFQPFERLETAYSGIEGAGIGLALSKRLVEAMDGRIGAQSTHGVGSTFWIELPQARSPLDMTGESGMDPPSVEAGANQRTLLCVEDNPANLRLMHRILGRRKNLSLIDAHTGELCIELARKQHPDLILLDIGLPGMDGFDTLRYLRADARTCDIPVVAVSANAMQRDIDRGIAEGFADYLTKPVDISRLLGILDRYLPDRTTSEA